jgi:hypothetical protein
MLVSTLEMQKACTNRTRAIAFSEESFGRPQAEVMDEVKKLIGLDKKEAKLAKMLEGRLEIRHD